MHSEILTSGRINHRGQARDSREKGPKTTGPDKNKEYSRQFFEFGLGIV